MRSLCSAAFTKSGNITKAREENWQKKEENEKSEKKEIQWHVSAYGNKLIYSKLGLLWKLPIYTGENNLKYLIEIWYIEANL